MRVQIGERPLGLDHPTYFIADISANHDGDLDRAKRLIELAKNAGADAAKFQNFQATKIVSDYGFRHLGAQISHQSKWTKPVTAVYEDASLPLEWTDQLARACADVGIDYFSTPYDFEAVEALDQHVPAYKIGSGDITWLEFLKFVADKGKPVLLATGAAEIGEVCRAVDTIVARNPRLVLMQCNTNYTGDDSNLDHIHLRALRTYKALYPDLTLGLSDHTARHATALGAVALGARVVEKHFTDDTTRPGPDHPFSMTPSSWSEMVARTRELERALGDSRKFIAENETETVIVQRRCLRASRVLEPGTKLAREDIDVLRPAPSHAISAADLGKVIGQRLRHSLDFGQEITWTDLQNS
ncbi:MAG: N-acetylneuraminate synthase [Acidobacteria bacterium]|nr:N-acetylneuraminate synthase [Acidobacteriota bacterium]